MQQGDPQIALLSRTFRPPPPKKIVFARFAHTKKFFGLEGIVFELRLGQI